MEFLTESKNVVYNLSADAENVQILSVLDVLLQGAFTLFKQTIMFEGF